jgi:hypothetical protein
MEKNAIEELAVQDLEDLDSGVESIDLPPTSEAV